MSRKTQATTAGDIEKGDTIVFERNGAEKTGTVDGIAGSRIRVVAVGSTIIDVDQVVDADAGDEQGVEE